MFFLCLKKKKHNKKKQQNLSPIVLHPLIPWLLLPFFPATFFFLLLLLLLLPPPFLAMSLAFFFVSCSHSPLSLPPHPPTTPETGLVYSVFSTSRLCAAVTVIFLSNICFSHLLISLGFSSSTASHIAAATDVHLIPLLKSLNCASPNLAPGHFKTCHLQFRSTCQEPVKSLCALASRAPWQREP